LIPVSRIPINLVVSVAAWKFHVNSNEWVKMKKTLSFFALSFALAITQSGAVHAQGYPAKAVTVIVPHGPGGANDAVARPFAQKIGERLHQAFVVENRAGAGGNIGIGVSARGSQDGYNLLLTVGSSYTISPFVYKTVPFDPKKDFEPIGLVATAPYVLIVNPELPVKTVQELIALAKSKPGQLHMASAGNGTLDHLLDMLHIPYKGASAANTDMVSGRVSVTFTSWPSVMSFVHAGKLRLIAVASSERSSLLPDVPTIAETVPGVAAMSWYGLFAPAGTPADVVATLRRETSDVLADKSFQASLKAQGAEAGKATPAQFSELIDTDLKTWSGIIEQTGARVE
jgi:tripartite-type tricarboxylate transporter receptor subunit TctC